VRLFPVSPVCRAHAKDLFAWAFFFEPGRIQEWWGISSRALTNGHLPHAPLWMGSGTGAAFRIPNSSVQIGDRSNILLEGAGRDNYDSVDISAAQRHTRGQSQQFLNQDGAHVVLGVAAPSSSSVTWAAAPARRSGYPEHSRIAPPQNRRAGSTLHPTRPRPPRSPADADVPLPHPLRHVINVLANIPRLRRYRPGRCRHR